MLVKHVIYLDKQLSPKSNCEDSFKRFRSGGLGILEVQKHLRMSIYKHWYSYTWSTFTQKTARMKKDMNQWYYNMKMLAAVALPSSTALSKCCNWNFYRTRHICLTWHFPIRYCLLHSRAHRMAGTYMATFEKGQNFVYLG